MNFDWETIVAKNAERNRAAEKRLGDYVPTTDEIETAFHEFAASITQSELSDAWLGKEDRSYPPALADWRTGMVAFRRWLSVHDDHVRNRQREALQSIHREVHAIFSWNSGIRYEEPCPDCHGAPGVHECGCWADEPVEYVCAECHRLGGVAKAQWPCPTAVAAGLTAYPEAVATHTPDLVAEGPEQQIKARLRAAGYEPTGLVLMVIRNMIQEAEVTGWNDAFDKVESFR